MTDAARWNATIHVGGLVPEVTPAALQAAFLPFGEIADCSIPGSGESNGHRGYGLIEFEDPEDIKDAIDNMDQAEIFGKTIKVRKATPPKNVNEGLGSKTALWEQEGWLAENAVSEEDKIAADRAKAGPDVDDGPYDPMQGLEGLDVAGPKPV